MPTMDLASIAAGVVAYGVSAVLAVVLVFGTFRLHAALLARRRDEEALLLAGHRSLALVLGASILSQAALLRHAVFPTMTVVRDLFLTRPSAAAIGRMLAQCATFWVVVAVASTGSVLLATWLFTRMTGRLPEREEILKDNLAVAIFYSLVLLAITVVLNEGIEDLSRSLIPYDRAGVVRLP
jgi:bacteriorhodopsin